MVAPVKGWPTSTGPGQQSNSRNRRTWKPKPKYHFATDASGYNPHYYKSPLVLYENGRAGNTIVDGEIEFIAYMTAVLMRAARADPTGLTTFCDEVDPKLRDFSRWLFRHASNAYYQTLKNGFPIFDVQDKLWETMKTGECFAVQRSFLATKIGYVFPDGEVPEDDNTPDPWSI